jgi:hypothetical protein
VTRWGWGSNPTSTSLRRCRIGIFNSIPTRPAAEALKQTCRRLIIDGPNCVIGSLPDHSLFMVQDRKKLRPGVVGGRPGVFAFSSELCGLDVAIPDRDKRKDFQPMHLDTAIVGCGSSGG